MALLDLLGSRWALRVLWELRGEGVASFRDLQQACGGISSSVLSERVRELRGAGIVAERGPPGYRLTSEGRALLAALEPVDEWAARWAERTARSSR
jgi:DNA-binding HxlR family transcriptional regulator